jgi:hypothetical protein
VNVAGGGEGFADERAGLVFGAGVMAGAGEGGFGVAGGHPDGVGNLLGLGVQPHHVQDEIAKPDPGRGGRRCGLGLVQFVAGCLDRGVEGVEHRVDEQDGVPWGAAQLEERGDSLQASASLSAPGRWHSHCA